MNELITNLAGIQSWIDNSPAPTELRTNDEFMSFVVQLMNRCLYLLRVGAALSPDERTANEGFTKHRAIVVGHMVRIAKLYEGFLIHPSSRKVELALVFVRLIFETAMRMEYLLASKQRTSVIRSYILTSYRPERDILQELRDKARKRPLIGIEKRMKRRIAELLRRDRISQRMLMNNKVWNVDRKDFRSILNALGYDPIYPYMFGIGSHAVHGSWHDIRTYHLKRYGRYFMPDIEFDDPDPRPACSLTHFCLQTLLRYLTWNKSDPDNAVIPVLESLRNLNRSIDIAHEASLGT